MIDLASKREVHRDHQLISWDLKEVVKHKNNCEYAEWIKAIEEECRGGRRQIYESKTINYRSPSGFFHRSQRTICEIRNLYFERTIQNNKHCCRKRLLLRAIIPCTSIRESTRIYKKTCLHLCEEDKRNCGSQRFTPKKDTEILKDIDVKIGHPHVVHDECPPRSEPLTLYMPRKQYSAS